MRISDWSSDVCSSDLESVDNGMPQRSLISLSVQPLRARSEPSRLPIVGCCVVIARGFLRFVRVADVVNAGRFPARDDLIKPRARICPTVFQFYDPVVYCAIDYFCRRGYSRARPSRLAGIKGAGWDLEVCANS